MPRPGPHRPWHKEYDSHVRTWGGRFWSLSYDAGSTGGANLAQMGDHRSPRGVTRRITLDYLE
ncbi:hypothetical protein GCM10009734_87730 [Nonomuraea bangladeshensis]